MATKKDATTEVRSWTSARGTIRYSRSHPGAGYALTDNAKTDAEKADNAKAAEGAK